MTKTLILAVDRDDDFGVKGHVETPVIGIEAAKEAVIALGTADPEDSDVNALLAAMNIYNDLKADGKDVEIALVCGNEKVGHRSDNALKEELTYVLDTVNPDSAILVDDGAEDAALYPMITSRVPVDSVRKVYVKQAPGIEGSFYILKKMISDPQKRKRFLVPLGFLLVAVALIYIIVNLYAYGVTKNMSYLISMSAPLVVFLIGALLLMYGYNSMDRIVDFSEKWFTQVRGNNITMTFSVLSGAMVIVGLIIGCYSIINILSNGILYVILVFIANVIWPFAFAIFFNDLGSVVEEYVERKRIGRSFMTKTITVFGVAMILQGLVDFLRTYIGYGSYDNTLIFMEFVLGVVLAIVATIINASYKKAMSAEGQAQ